jgi:RimJ/RimL family protein N-acetyltransferase
VTGAVTLRPYRPDDYDVVRRWIDDPVVDGGFPSAAPLHDDEEVRAIVHDESRPNLDRFAVVVDDRVVGEAQIRHSSPVFPDRVFGLGIAIFDPADRGRGFGREAQRQLADLLFRDRDARRVQAETDPHNVAERRALEAIGFVNEGVLRRYFDGAGELGDLVMYAMTRDDWEEVSDGWTSTG